ncbi:MAG: metal-dependent hydrolase [bacterium]
MSRARAVRPTRRDTTQPVVRRLDLAFDPAVVPRAWLERSPHVSVLMNGLSLLFPEGEKFFVQSVKHFANALEDPALRKRVAAFVGQEALHGSEHRAFNAMLRAQGDEVAVQLEREVRWLLILGHRVLSRKAQLGVTCALEHYTAILAEELLSRPDLQATIDPSVRPLWLWHALEESEHKSVAYDVYEAVGGGYVTRVAMMLLATVFFLAEIGNTHLRLTRARGALLDVRGWLALARFLGSPSGLLPRLARPYLDYFRPRFHPADRDTRALVESWSAHFATLDRNSARGRRGSRRIERDEPRLAAAAPA